MAKSGRTLRLLLVLGLLVAIYVATQTTTAPPSPNELRTEPARSLPPAAVGGSTRPAEAIAVVTAPSPGPPSNNVPRAANPGLSPLPLSPGEVQTLAAAIRNYRTIYDRLLRARRQYWQQAIERGLGPDWVIFVRQINQEIEQTAAGVDSVASRRSDLQNAQIVGLHELQAVRGSLLQIPSTIAFANQQDFDAQSAYYLQDMKAAEPVLAMEKPAALSADARSAAAAKNLELAKTFARNGAAAEAKKLLLRIIADYPGTEAAAEAERLSAEK